MTKEVIISFDQSGGTHVDAEGFVGNECADATSVFLRVFSSDDTEEHKKPEYHQSAGTSESIGTRRM